MPLLAGRTYSLSSVTSSDDLIAFVAVTGLVTFAVSWVVTAFPLRTFQGGPGRAASLTVALALVTVYLLALPILWSYALNGLFVTWALPDFGSLFLGLISGVQALAVAAGGLILCGVAALIAWPISRKRRSENRAVVTLQSGTHHKHKGPDQRPGPLPCLLVSLFPCLPV